MTATTSAKPEQLWNRDFTLSVLVSLLIYLYPFLLISTFPFYIRSLGGDEVAVGMAASLFSTSAMLARPVAGYVCDHYSRSLLLYIGLAAIVLVSLGYAFWALLPLVLLLRLLHGMFHGLVGVGLTLHAYDSLCESRFAEGVGFFGMTTALPMAVAPALGLWLMNNYGFRPLFLLLAGLILLALALASRFRFPPLPRQRSRFRLGDVFDRRAVPASLIVLFAFLPYSGVSAFIALFASQRGLGDLGLFFLLWAVSSTAMRFIFGRLCDRRGEALPILAGNLCFAGGLLLSVLATAPWMFYLGAVVYGGGFGVLAPAVQTMSVAAVPPERRGAASSTYLIFCDLGGVIGGALAGLLARELGYLPMFLVLGCGALVSAALYLCWGRRTPSARAIQRKARLYRAQS